MPGLTAKKRRLMYLDIMEDRPLTEDEQRELKEVSEQISKLFGEHHQVGSRIASGRSREGDKQRLLAIEAELGIDTNPFGQADSPPVQPYLDIEQRDKVFGIFCKLSDQQCDPVVKGRLQKMVGRPNVEIKDELLGIIDDAVYSSLTSGFEIAALRYIWDTIGGSAQELAERNQMLNTKDPAEQKELQRRFKWQCAGFHNHD